MLEEKDPNSWEEYIKQKFNYPNLFKIDDENKALTIVTSLINNTRIYFNWLDDKKSLLDDIQFSNSQHKGWSGETLQEYNYPNGMKFNAENLKIVDDILDIPMFTGWISISYFIGKINYRTESYTNESKLEVLCIEQKWFALPFYPIIDLLLKLGVVGHKKESFVEPIVSDEKTIR